MLNTNISKVTLMSKFTFFTSYKMPASSERGFLAPSCDEFCVYVYSVHVFVQRCVYSMCECVHMRVLYMCLNV